MSLSRVCLPPESSWDEVGGGWGMSKERLSKDTAPEKGCRYQFLAGKLRDNDLLMSAVGFLRVPVAHVFFGKNIIHSRETVFIYSFAGGGEAQGWRRRGRGRGHLKENTV